MAGLDPADIARTKTPLIANAHLATGHEIDRVVRVPVQTGIKAGGKISLNQKGLSGSQDSRGSRGSSMRVVEGFPLEVIGTDVLCIGHIGHPQDRW